MVTRNGQALVIAVLGLGEAGSALASDLVAAEVRVRGYDPAVTAAEPVIDTASEAEAARGADLALSVNSAKAAVDALRAGLPGVRQGRQPRRGEGQGGSRGPDVLWADLMEAAADMLTELGVSPLMADASRALHARLTGDGNP